MTKEKDPEKEARKKRLAEYFSDEVLKTVQVLNKKKLRTDTIVTYRVRIKDDDGEELVQVRKDIASAMPEAWQNKLKV